MTLTSNTHDLQILLMIYRVYNLKSQLSLLRPKCAGECSFYSHIYKKIIFHSTTLLFINFTHVKARLSSILLTQ